LKKLAQAAAAADKMAQELNKMSDVMADAAGFNKTEATSKLAKLAASADAVAKALAQNAVKNGDDDSEQRYFKF
jgi:uncharacterized protein with beta-barrel porin domain